MLKQGNEGGCCWKDKSLHPLCGVCMTETIIYEASVDSTTAKDIVLSEKNMGLTERNFKTSFNNHTLGFKHWAKDERSNYPVM